MGKGRGGAVGTKFRTTLGTFPGSGSAVRGGRELGDGRKLGGNGVKGGLVVVEHAFACRTDHEDTFTRPLELFSHA